MYIKNYVAEYSCLQKNVWIGAFSIVAEIFLYLNIRKFWDFQRSTEEILLAKLESEEGGRSWRRRRFKKPLVH